MAPKRDPNALYCDDASLAQQHFAEECDINEILRRSALTGSLPVSNRTPVYGDFTQVPKSLLEAMAMVKQANDLFDGLGWQVRERFGNNAEKMIAFLNDSKNRDEAIKLGLVKPAVADTPAPVSPPAGEPVDVVKASKKASAQ